MLLLLIGLTALAVPAQAQIQRPAPTDPSGQYDALHPLPPPSPGSVDVLQAMPPVQTQGDINYVSGGIGGDEREALRKAAPNYNLHLLFAGEGGGEYLSSVKVTIVDQQGVVVLDAISNGPYFMAKISPGRYKVSAELGGGRSQTRVVTVPPHGTLSTSFFWRAAS
jgi:hypothetical protein